MIYKGFLIVEDAASTKAYRSLHYKNSNTVSYEGSNPNEVYSTIDQMSDVGDYKEEDSPIILPSAPEPEPKYTVRLGRLKTVRELYKDHRIDIEPLSTIRAYHFTRKENVDPILRNGLFPRSDVGLGGPKPSVLPAKGVYLASSMEEVWSLLDDYNLREERIPGTFSVLAVDISSEIRAYEDPEVLSRWGEPPTLIVPQPIGPDSISLYKEDFYTTDPITGIYREFPGYMARRGHRVRLTTGEYADEGGVVEGIPDLVDRKAIWNVRLDSGEVIRTSEDDLITLIL